MQLLPFLYPALLSLLLLEPASALGNKNQKSPKDAILLSNVKTLTLRADKKTAHRRVPAVPQLTCQGPGCAHHKIDIMRCTNQGSDYEAEDIQWSCTANIPEEFKLGSTEVICEGYDNAADERVLKGSCAVEYRLVLTDKGEERYGTTWWGGSKDKSKGREQAKAAEDNWTWDSILFMVLFVGVAIWILVSACNATQNAPRARRPRGNGGWGGWGGGGGGGGGDGGDDPPPPYPGKYSSSQEGWRPGFWSGAATGAAAGYMAGNRGQRQEPAVQNNRGWFGGGNDNAGSWGAGPSRSSGSRSSGSGSSTRHESTGFGSTSRR
ncbi:Transmembrane 66 [Hyphodiscus hymeniophilus]|uniref:Store-operated calcium entry-associated regulatory factor n=1 Tax=Hyphodiscus hymeniophilus TaxID=353542 RepID=A0A9P6VPP0_9HELO|nr:Transmembrane 66 [Hyphodiscus hymeniophilus]